MDVFHLGKAKVVTGQHCALLRMKVPRQKAKPHSKEQVLSHVYTVPHTCTRTDTHVHTHRHTQTNTHRHTHTDRQTQTERLKFNTHTIQSKTPEQSCHKKNVTHTILNRQRELKDVKS